MLDVSEVNLILVPTKSVGAPQAKLFFNSLAETALENHAGNCCYERQVGKAWRRHREGMKKAWGRRVEGMEPRSDVFCFCFCFCFFFRFTFTFSCFVLALSCERRESPEKSESLDRKSVRRPVCCHRLRARPHTRSRCQMSRGTIIMHRC